MYDKLRKTMIAFCLTIAAVVTADEGRHRIMPNGNKQYHNPEYILQDFNKNFFW